MRQIHFALVFAFILATALVIPAAANSHVTVTTPPQTGVGAIEVFPLSTVALLLVTAFVLVALSVREWRRA